MELDPLQSKDLNHGVPPYFNKILDELLDDSETIIAVRGQTVKMAELMALETPKEAEEEHSMINMPKAEDPSAERLRAS